MKTIFKIEVIADNSGHWCGNQIEYSTFDTARIAAIDLANRWLSVRRARVIGVDTDNENKLVSDSIVFG